MVGAFVLITLGVLFLLNNLYPARFEFGRMWPVILIVIGVVKIVEYFQRQGAPEDERPGGHHRRRPHGEPLPAVAPTESSPPSPPPVRPRSPSQSPGYRGGPEQPSPGAGGGGGTGPDRGGEGDRKP